MKPKILFVSPVKDFSGYASVARDYVMALDKAGADVVTRALRYDGGDYVPSQRFAELEDKDVRNVDIVFQQTTPNEMAHRPEKFNVGAFCWETDRIPDVWVNSLNAMDLVLVPCDENLEVARRCGVVVPMEKVHYATDVSRYKKPVKPYLFPRSNDDFKFLSIFQFSKKKALEVLLKSYLSEFSSKDNVCLIIKTYVGPKENKGEREYIQNMIGAVKELLRIKDYPRIHLIHEIMSHEEIERLYASSNCYVLPSRGEGWGVPHMDALGFGLPAIGTQGTGPEEFIDDSCGWLVDSHKSPVIDMPHPHEFLYTGKENWHEPHAGHLKECMREAYESWKTKDVGEAWNAKCLGALRKVENFSHEAIGPRLLEVIVKYYDLWKRANNVS